MLVIQTLFRYGDDVYTAYRNGRLKYPGQDPQVGYCVIDTKTGKLAEGACDWQSSLETAMAEKDALEKAKKLRTWRITHSETLVGVFYVEAESEAEALRAWEAKCSTGEVDFSDMEIVDSSDEAELDDDTDAAVDDNTSERYLVPKYGKDDVRIKLLSKEEYETVKNNIPLCDDYWWLRSRKSSSAYYVNRDGYIDDYTLYYTNFGVRPAFRIRNLESEIRAKVQVGRLSCTVIDKNLVLSDSVVCHYCWDSHRGTAWEESDLHNYLQSDEFSMLVFGEKA